MQILSALILGLMAAAPAAAIPMFTVTSSPTTVSVFEGNPGIFQFTVKNVGAQPITIFDVRLVINSVPDSIVFLSGDINDEVFNTTILMANNCETKTLATNGTCVFQQSFQTRDLNPGDSGLNFGKWNIFNTVEIGGPLPFLDRIVIGKGIVKVFDAAIPEASTGLLTSMGLVALTVLRRGSRTRDRG